MINLLNCLGLEGKDYCIDGREIMHGTFEETDQEENENLARDS